MDQIIKKRRRRRRWLIGLAMVGVVYLAAYVILSRLGYREADRQGFRGFYYLPPKDSEGWRTVNYGCAYLFWPLNAVDCWLGTGRKPAFEPSWGLSRLGGPHLRA
jgi:hypothetical protein